MHNACVPCDVSRRSRSNNGHYLLKGPPIEKKVKSSPRVFKSDIYSKNYKLTCDDFIRLLAVKLDPYMSLPATMGSL